jgi:putative ABC transport system permease protein
MSERLPAVARLILRAIAPGSRRTVVEGDLLELRALRAGDGRRDLTRALYCDLLSIAIARLRGGLPARVPRDRAVDRPQGGLHMLDDLRFALRLVRRQPLAALVLILTLAIGIGASTAVFAICDRLLLRPLPYPDADRIVALDRVGFSIRGDRMVVSPAVAASPAIASAGLYLTGGLNLGDAGGSARVRAAAVSAGFFGALGAQPRLGRVFVSDEDARNDAVVVISDGLWRARFGARPDVTSETVRLNGKPFQIIGVMPPGYTFPDNADVWIPSDADSQVSGEASAPQVVARLAEGMSLAQATAALQAINDARRARRPDITFEPILVTPLQEFLVGPRRPMLLLLAAIVSLFLLATAANVAGLMLARVRARRREFEVRAALGATRGRLAAQLVVEAMTVTSLGGAAGFVLAFLALRAFTQALPLYSRGVDVATIDVRLVFLAAIVMAIAAALVAVIPAIAAGRRPTSFLREGATSTERTRWSRGALVMLQVAVALVLLTVTTGALSVLARLTKVEIGFHNDHAVAFELTIPRARYTTDAAVASVVQAIVDRLRLVPGVDHAGATGFAPGSSAMAIGIALRPEAEDGGPPGNRPYATMLPTSPGYFESMGIPLLAGRTFRDSDGAGAPPVVILSKSAARELWPDAQSAIGQTFRTSMRLKQIAEFEVVGVVEDVRLRNVTSSPSPQAYFALAQRPPYGSASVAVSVAGDPAAAVPALRDAIRSVDPDLPPYGVILVRELRARYLAAERITLAITGGCAVIALVLAAVGLFGVLSNLVAQRTREIGIRVALGADQRRLRLGVLGAGMKLAGTGAIAGVAIAALASQLIAHFVPALDAPSAATIAVDVLVMLSASAAATWIPARRASAVDPLVALKSE